MSNLRKNLVYNILLQASNILFPIITFPYVTRVLGPEGLGQANFAQNFCLYFILFATLGIPIYGNREIAKVKDDKVARSRLFWEITCIKLLTSLLVLIPYFIVVLNSEKFSDYLAIYLWGAFYILADVLTIEWFFSAMENFRYITIRSVIVKFFYVVSLFLFVHDSTDVLIYFILIVLSTLVNGVVNMRYAFQFVNMSRQFSLSSLKQHVKPLLLLFSYYLAISMYTMLDTILLGLLATNASVGFYTAAMRLVKICLTLTSSLSQVLLPRLASEVAKSNFSEISRLINKSVNVVFTFSIPLMAGVYLLAPELIAIFSGSEFVPAEKTLRILSLLLLVIGMANVFAVQILIPLSKDRLLLFGSLIGGSVSIGLNFVLIPTLEQDGAAIALVAAELVVMLFTFWCARKSLTFQVPLKDFALNVLTALPFALIVYLARMLFENSILIVLFTSAISASLFFFFQYFVFKNQLIMEQVKNLTSKFSK